MHSEPTPNPFAITFADRRSVRLLTGNGPQAIHQQTAKLRDILARQAGGPEPRAAARIATTAGLATNAADGVGPR
jgi:hypothetical protein